MAVYGAAVRPRTSHWRMHHRALLDMSGRPRTPTGGGVVFFLTLTLVRVRAGGLSAGYGSSMLAMAMVPSLLLVAAAASPSTLIRLGSRVRVAQQQQQGQQQRTIEVATLAEAAAQLATTLAGSGGSGDVVVELAPGAHRVPVGGLVLGPAHTPSSSEHSVTWRCGADVGSSGACVVHGAELITDPWRPCGHCAANGTMVAPVPQALKGRRLRHFYVNGLRASRTRSNPADLFGNPPHFGMRYFGPSTLSSQCTARPQPCPHNNSRSYCQSDPAKGQCELPPVKACPPCPQPGSSSGSIVSGYTITNETAAQGDFEAYRQNPEDIEMVYPDTGNNWAEARCAVASVDAKHKKFIMQQPCHWNLYHRPWQPAKDAAPRGVENVRSALTKPGQFYYDRARAEVLYLPRSGEDLATSTAVFAAEETLVLHNTSARHTWEGISFEYATWLRPMQGDGYVPSPTHKHLWVLH
jgi:hypothetical protein